MWWMGLILAFGPLRGSAANTIRSLDPSPQRSLDNVFTAAPTTEEASFLCSQYGLGDNESCSPDNLSVAYDNLNVTLFFSLFEVTGLDELLRCPGPMTVLLPTNEAVVDLGEDTLKFLLDPLNRDDLVTLLLYHVLPTTSLQSGRISTLANGSSVIYQQEAITFDGSMVSAAGFGPSCNGQVVPLQKVLNPFTNTDRPSTLPSTLPSLTPSVTPSSIPSVSPSSSQVVVETLPFVIHYNSQNATRPTEENFSVLNERVEAYFSDLFASLFESNQGFEFVSLNFEIDFTLHGDDALPGFNLFVQYRPAVFQFSHKSGVGIAPTESGLFEEMKNGITVDFLLDVVRTQLDTAFAQVITARMTVVPVEERLGQFIIAYNSENVTKPSDEIFQRLSQENEAYFNFFLQSVLIDENNFLGLALRLESTIHGSDPALPVGFNIGLQYSSAIFFFTQESDTSNDLELLDLLQSSFTFEYLLDVRRVFDGTAFGGVIEGLLDVV